MRRPSGVASRIASSSLAKAHVEHFRRLHPEPPPQAATATSAPRSKWSRSRPGRCPTRQWTGPDGEKRLAFGPTGFHLPPTAGSTNPSRRFRVSYNHAMFACLTCSASSRWSALIYQRARPLWQTPHPSYHHVEQLFGHCEAEGDRSCPNPVWAETTNRVQTPPSGRSTSACYSGVAVLYVVFDKRGFRGAAGGRAGEKGHARGLVSKGFFPTPPLPPGLKAWRTSGGFRGVGAEEGAEMLASRRFGAPHRPKLSPRGLRKVIRA